MISLKQKKFLENISRRNVDSKLTHNSPSNIGSIYDSFYKVIFKIIIGPDDTYEGEF